MLTRLLRPVVAVGRILETASLVYVAGKVGVSAYQQVKKMNREARYAGVLRDKFEQDYREKFGSQPAEELVQLTLKSYNAVEHPFRQLVKDTYEKTVGKCVEITKPESE